jgi:hypothetical protein
MSLDRIHDVNGLMQFSAQPTVGTTGTASTVASNLFPGGYQFGAVNGIAAGTNSSNGGAPYLPYLPRGTTTNDFQSFTTTGMITHDNVALVNLSVSTTGIALNLQQAAYDGQMLTIAVQPGTTGSIVSTLNTTGIGGTTTAACQVLRAALTFASTTCIILQAQKLGQTASTNVPYVWSRIL